MELVTILESQSKELEKPIFMCLISKTHSEEARNFQNDLVGIVHKQLAKAYKPTQKLRNAIGAILADLLKAAAMDPPRRCFRTKDIATFAKQGADLPGFPTIGYYPFIDAFNGLFATGYIDVVPGQRQSPKEGATAPATELWATPKLVDLAAFYGVSSAHWDHHFVSRPRPSHVARPIILKAGSERQYGEKIKGASITLDKTDARIMALSAQVQRLNAYFATVDIGNATHAGFCRIFNLGDTTGAGLDKGGRLYSIGGGYQAIEKKQRPFITLNGSRTVEIDISGSHLTIVHALCGKPLAVGDPYAGIGYDRDIVKMWVAQTLGHDRFHTKWSPTNSKRYRKDNPGRTLGKDYPIKAIHEAVCAAVPLLNEWPNIPIWWGELQYIESEALLNTITKLAFDCNIPALPVHDSIIVAVEHQEIAATVFTECFQARIGCQPTLKRKQLQCLR